MEKVEFLILRNLLHNEEYLRKVIPFIKSEYFEDHDCPCVLQYLSTPFRRAIHVLAIHYVGFVCTGKGRV